MFANIKLPLNMQIVFYNFYYEKNNNTIYINQHVINVYSIIIFVEVWG